MLSESAMSIDNIQVVVRVRPMSTREKQDRTQRCLVVTAEDRTSICLLEGSESTPFCAQPVPRQFTMDFVAGEDSSQEELFDVVGKPVVSATLDGTDKIDTMPAYLATARLGAGKTYTMYGSESAPGLQPRMLQFLFQNIDQTGATEYAIKCQFYEIYNEQIIDLLSSSRDSTPLQVRCDLQRGVYVENIIQESVNNAEEAMEIVRRGVQNRHVGETRMNIESSRSHSVFTASIVASRRSREGMLTIKSSKLHFVDLAGSERQSKTQCEGQRFLESTNINKSLSNLGRVINSLADVAKGRRSHVPYRDSKLTFLLKDSIGGNSKTCMIAAVSPAASQLAETLNTLNYAQRAKQIENKAVVNEEQQGDALTLKREIRRLKQQLCDAQAAIGHSIKMGEQLSKSSVLRQELERLKSASILQAGEHQLQVERLETQLKEAYGVGQQVGTTNNTAAVASNARNNNHCRERICTTPSTEVINNSKPIISELLYRNFALERQLATERLEKASLVRRLEEVQAQQRVTSLRLADVYSLAQRFCTDVCDDAAGGVEDLNEQQNQCIKQTDIEQESLQLRRRLLLDSLEELQLLQAQPLEVEIAQSNQQCQTQITNQQASVGIQEQKSAFDSNELLQTVATQQRQVLNLLQESVQINRQLAESASTVATCCAVSVDDSSEDEQLLEVIRKKIKV